MIDVDRRKRPVTGRLLCAAVLLALAGCGDSGTVETFEYEVMGTVASGRIHVADGAAEGAAAPLVQATFDSVNIQLSTWNDDSEVGRFNNAPAGTTGTTSAWLGACLAAAQELQQISGGAFDPGAGPLMRLWGFTRRQGYLPTAAELDSVRALLGGFEYDPTSGALTKTRDGARLDLGGIAKGFAVDRAAANLVAAGFGPALIDLGGNICALGSPPGRSAWRIGVRDPLDRDRIFAAVSLADRTVATSGSYERFVVIAGQRYGHIMNPATGRPAEGLLSATVISASATLADGLSTTLFVLGPDRSIALLRDHYPTVDAILILPGDEPNTARVLATSGLQKRLVLRPEYEEHYSLEFLEF